MVTICLSQHWATWGTRTAPPRPSWAYAGGCTQPPESCSPNRFCSPGYSPGAAWEPSGTPGHSTLLAPAGTEQHPARLGRLAIKAIPSLKQVCLHWALMALLAATGTVSISPLCLQLCPCNTELPAWLLHCGLGAGRACEHSLQLHLPSAYCPFKISPRSPFTF